MRVIFRPKIINQPINVMLAPLTFMLYSSYKMKRIIGCLASLLTFGVFSFLLVNGLFNLTTISILATENLLCLIVSCAAMIFFVLCLFGRKHEACLIYGCLNTDASEDYINQVIAGLQEKLSPNVMRVTFPSNKTIRKIYKTIDESQRMLELCKAIKDMNIEEAVFEISRAKAFDTFCIKILKDTGAI